MFHLLFPIQMSPKFKKFIASWVINTFAVGLAGLLMRSHITYHGNFLYLVLASLLLGILNSVLKPALKFFALPLLLLTLGLFMFVINALLLYLVGVLLHPWFSVDTFWSAFKGALIISIVSAVLNSLTSSSVRVDVRRNEPPRGPGPGGNGPVIDV